MSTESIKPTDITAHLDMLGKTVRERVTGHIGIATAVSFDLYGCITVAITPRLDKDGKPVGGKWFDIQRAEVIPDHDRVMPLPVTTRHPTKHLALGRKARDLVTGFEGTISSVAFDLFGSIDATVTPPVGADGKVGDNQWLQFARLDIDQNAERAMPLPAWAAQPAQHTHGAAEKPEGSIR